MNINEIERIEWGGGRTWRARVTNEYGRPNYCDTDNAYYIRRDQERNERRFERLSFGRSGSDPFQIVDMELIWMTSMLKIEKFGCDDWDVFKWALDNEDPGVGALHGLEDRSFNFFRDMALEVGVDYRIESYLSGVPLEYVIGEQI